MNFAQGNCRQAALSTSKYLLVLVNTQIFETLPVVLVAGVSFGNSCNSATDARDDMSCLRHSRGHIGSGGRIIGRSTDELVGFKTANCPLLMLFETTTNIKKTCRLYLNCHWFCHCFFNLPLFLPLVSKFPAKNMTSKK